MQNSQKNVKKILIASTSSDYGGGPKVVFDFLSHSKNSGFTYIICAPDGIYFEKFKALGLTVYKLPLNKINLKTFWEFYNLLKKEKIDLVNAHGKGAGLYARICGILASVKVIQTFHGIHVPKSRFKHIFYVFLEKILTTLTTKIVNVSISQKNQGEELGLFPYRKSVAIPNGVDLKEIDKIIVKRAEFRQTLGLRSEDFVLAMVARFDPVKGHERLVKLLPRIPPTSVPLKILFAGDGGEEERIKQLVQKLKVESRVKFLGFRDDAIKILKVSDALIIPSFREGLPTAVLEAMACRLPTIGSKTIGISEVVMDGKSGYLIDFDRSTERFKEVVYRLYNDVSLRKRIGDFARKIVEKDYSMEGFVNSTENLYREILKNKNI